MRKPKTPQDIQDQIERIVAQIEERKKPLDDEVIRLIKRKQQVERLLPDLDDPHALIPPGCKSVTEWIADEGCMTPIIAMHIFRNKRRLQCSIPRDGSKSGWNIVRCKPASYYRDAVAEIMRNIKEEGL